MARSISIRQSLLRSLALVILLLSGALLAATFLAARRTISLVSRSVMTQTLEATAVRLDGFFEPGRRVLLTLQGWGEAGLLDGEQAELDRLLLPLLAQHPHISALMVADARGREYRLTQDGAGGSSRQVRRDEWPGRARWLEWTGDAPEPVETWAEIDYDPRTRPWYRGAVARRGASPTAPGSEAPFHWTEPYVFFTAQEPGITASLSFDSGDGVERVIGVDILLRELSEFTTGLHVGERGVVLVLTPDRAVIGLPRDERYTSAENRKAALLKRPAELGLPVIADAVEVVGPDPRLGEPFRFPSGGEPWWGELRDFALAPDHPLWIAVVVPQDELLGQVGQFRVWIAVATLAVLAVALLQAHTVARRFSGPIEALVQQSDRIAVGDLGAAEPLESRTTEVRRLADAQERMRVALRTLLKLERDLQIARSIQQQTFPEQLPTLRGFEIAAFSQPAEETGGDSYDAIGLRGRRSEGRIVITIQEAERAVLLMADATGHGIGPALSVAQIRAMLRMAVRSGEELSAIARHLNEQLCDDLPPGRFITAWLGELDAAACRLTSFSAGQAPLLRYDAERDHYDLLDADAPPFGVVAELDVSLSDPILMKPGDLFAVFSDGILEAADPAGEQFGTDRVIELLRAQRRESPERMLAALRQAVDAFTRGTAPGDDRTAVLVKRSEA